MITPLPFGGGDGGGAIIFLTLCVLFLCVLCEKKICHSLFVIMSFCLQKNIYLPQSLCYSVFKKNICLPPSLCHSVFKKTSVSLCHYVILSENAPVGDGSGPSCCCYCYVSFCLISAFHKLYYVLLHYFSLIYSF